MQVFLYAHTNDNIELDSIRRLSFIANILQKKNCEPILLVNNLKAGLYAKNRLEVKEFIYLDHIEELEKYIKRGDIFVYEKNKDIDKIEEKICSLCTLIYNIPDDIPQSIIDTNKFKKHPNHKIETLFFYGDDDFNDNLIEDTSISNIDIPLLLGYNFSKRNEHKLKSNFNNIINEESYESSINNCKFLLSGSLYTCLEAIKAGTKPVLLKRKDKTYDEKLIKNLHIPFIKETNIASNITEFYNIVKHYPKIYPIEEFDIDSIIRNIQIRIETYKKLTL